MACVDVQGAELGLILCSHNPETPYILNKGLAFSFSPELWHGTLSRQGSVMFLSADGGGPRQQTGAWGKTAFHSAVSITLTSLSCLTLPSSLLVLKFQRLLFLYCSSPFARKRPGLSLSRSATIPSSRSLSVRAASLAKTRVLEGKGPGPQRNCWAHRDPGRAGEELSPLHEAWESDSENKQFCVRE